MTAKDLVQSLKSTLERESLFEGSETLIQMQGNQKIAIATVAVEVEGKIRMLEVTARDLGFYDGIEN